MICCVRSASVAASAVGSASASSSELVWSELVPPSTAASACSAVRTTLLYGCCAVSETPAVCVWKRSFHERSSFAPKRSRITSAQILRAARNLAISSKKSLCELKKKEIRGANVVDVEAGVDAVPDVLDAVAQRERELLQRRSIRPRGCGSRSTEIVFHFGTSFAQKAKMSVMSRIDWRGGKMYSFCAMNSFRMSFWIVPESVLPVGPLLLGDRQIHREDHRAPAS